MGCFCSFRKFLLVIHRMILFASLVRVLSLQPSYHSSPPQLLVISFDFYHHSDFSLILRTLPSFFPLQRKKERNPPDSSMFAGKQCAFGILKINDILREKNQLYPRLYDSLQQELRVHASWT